MAAESLRLDSDRRLQDELLADPELRRIGEELRGREGRDLSRRRLLADSLRVTERVIPSLAAAVRECRAAAGLGGEAPELYVGSDPRQNAACFDHGEGRLSLFFTSGLLERMSAAELRFIIGHELGHAVYGHAALPAAAILQRDGTLAPAKALALMSWSRRAEISCDRVGLLCCGSLQTACIALMKLSCGLGEPLLSFRVDDYLAQMRDLQSLVGGPESGEWYSSHPFSPLRVAALQLFSRSKPFAAAGGTGPGVLGEDELARRVEGLLGAMEPGRAESGPEAAEALLWGGYWVSCADGRVDPRETESLRGFVAPERLSAAAAECCSAGDRLAFVKGRFAEAARSCRSLPVSDRHALLQKLAAVARADGRLEPAESEALAEIARALDVDATFVDRIMALLS